MIIETNIDSAKQASAALGSTRSFIEGPLGRRTDFWSSAATLSDRERQTLICILFGHSNDLAASRLGISARTLEIHRKAMMRKMGARTASALIVAAFRA